MWDSFRPQTIEDLGILLPTAETMTDTLTERVRAFRMPPVDYPADIPWHPDQMPEWRLLWALAMVPNLHPGSLRDMVDEPPLVQSQFYQALWELRFFVKDDMMAAPVLYQGMVEWLMGYPPRSGPDTLDLRRAGIHREVLDVHERATLLLFMLTLASENGLLTRVIFGFEGFDDAIDREDILRLRQFASLMERLDTWVKVVRAPIGLMVGLNPTVNRLTQLKKLHKKLGARVEAGLGWAR